MGEHGNGQLSLNDQSGLLAGALFGFHGTAVGYEHKHNGMPSVTSDPPCDQKFHK